MPYTREKKKKIEDKHNKVQGLFPLWSSTQNKTQQDTHRECNFLIK